MDDTTYQKVTHPESLSHGDCPMSNIPFIPAAGPRTELPPARPQTPRQRTGELITAVEDPGEHALSGIHGDQQNQQENKKKHRPGEDPASPEEPRDIVELKSAEGEGAAALPTIHPARATPPAPPRSSLDISA